MRDLIRSNIKKEINRVLIERKSDEAHYRLAMLYLNGWFLNSSKAIKTISVSIDRLKSGKLFNKLKDINFRTFRQYHTKSFTDLFEAITDCFVISIECKRKKVEQNELEEMKEISSILKSHKNYPVFPNQLALFFNDMQIIIKKLDKRIGGDWNQANNVLRLNLKNFNNGGNFARSIFNFLEDKFRERYYQYYENKSAKDYNIKPELGFIAFEDITDYVEDYFKQILNDPIKWKYTLELETIKDVFYHELGHAFDNYVAAGPYTDVYEKMYPLSRRSKDPSNVYYSAGTEIQAQITKLNIRLNLKLDEIDFLFRVFEKIFKKGKKKKIIKKYTQPFKSMIYLRDMCHDFSNVDMSDTPQLINPKLKGDFKNLKNILKQAGKLEEVRNLCGKMAGSLDYTTNDLISHDWNEFSVIFNFIGKFKYEDRNIGINAYINEYAIPVFGEGWFKKIESGYTLPKKRHGRTKNRKYSGRKQANKVLSRMLDLLLSAVKKYEEASKFYR